MFYLLKTWGRVGEYLQKKKEKPKLISRSRLIPIDLGARRCPAAGLATNDF